MTIFVLQKHALGKRIFDMYPVKLIMKRTGANGTLLSHKEKQAFVSRNQQENAYNNQIRVIY